MAGGGLCCFDVSTSEEGVTSDGGIDREGLLVMVEGDKEEEGEDDDDDEIGPSSDSNGTNLGSEIEEGSFSDSSTGDDESGRGCCGDGGCSVA